MEQKLLELKQCQVSGHTDETGTSHFDQISFVLLRLWCSKNQPLIQKMQGA